MSADPQFRRSVLPSGLAVVTERLPHRQSLSFGVWCRSGARDEPVERLGISHFIEHMMFKGTATRDARAIAASLESVGGHLDAFTSREQVCYYARTLSEYLPEVVDVLSDIVCRSAFADGEIAREKSVVREEIFQCADDPDDRVTELFAEQLWGAHGLGRPILGTVETVEGLDRDGLCDYFRARYRADQLVVSAAGDVEHDRVLERLAVLFDPPAGEPRELSQAPGAFAPYVRHEANEDLQQLYLALGTRGIAYGDADRFALVLLHTLLGGGMSSRLFQSVREEAGLAYSVYSNVDFHRDCGGISIHLGVSPARGRESLARVRDELERLAAEGPAADEVEAARAQVRGNLLMGQESVSNRMYQLAHDEIYAGRYVPAEEHLERVLAVTHADVARIASRFLVPGRFTLTALGPTPGGALTERDWAAPIAD